MTIPDPISRSAIPAPSGGRDPFDGAVGAFLRIQEADANARQAAAATNRTVTEKTETPNANVVDTFERAGVLRRVRFPRNWKDVRALSDQITAWAWGERDDG